MGKLIPQGMDRAGLTGRADDRDGADRLWTAALARVATDDGSRYDLDEVAAEFGIDPSELDDDED